jgi:hypothetical protein
MACYNRRFATIAKRRRRLGLLGRTNKGNRCLIPGFTLERKDMFRLFGMLKEWAMLELREGFHTWGRSEDEAPAVPETPVAQTEM